MRLFQYCHANPCISLIAQCEHVGIFAEAHCVNLGFLLLDVKVEKNIFRLSKGVKVFLGYILFHYNFFQKLKIPQVSLALEFLWSADQQFRNTPCLSENKN